MTNQASEELKQRLSATKTFNYNVYFGVDGGDYAISFDEAIDEIVSLIRTEKLKLLAEVRERVVGENTELPKYLTDWDEKDGEEYWYNKLRTAQMSVLTKLEAEL